jgi:hypothetical protein
MRELTATTRPEKLGRPFTRWSVRKLAAYLAEDGGFRVLLNRGGYLVVHR